MYNYPQNLGTQCVQLPGLCTGSNFDNLAVGKYQQLYVGFARFIPMPMHRLFRVLDLLQERLCSSSTRLTITTTIKYKERY